MAQQPLPLHSYNISAKAHNEYIAWEEWLWLFNQAHRTYALFSAEHGASATAAGPTQKNVWRLASENKRWNGQWMSGQGVWAHILIKRPQTATPGFYKHKNKWTLLHYQHYDERRTRAGVCGCPFYPFWWNLRIFNARRNMDEAFALVHPMFTREFIRKTDCFSIHNVLLWMCLSNTHTYHHPRPDAWSGLVCCLVEFTSFYFHFSKRRIECQRATRSSNTELCRQRNEPEIEYFVSCQRTYFCTWMDDNEHISILSLVRTICENGKFLPVLCYRVNSQFLEGMHICGYHFQFWIFGFRMKGTARFLCGASGTTEPLLD